MKPIQFVTLLFALAISCPSAFAKDVSASASAVVTILGNPATVTNCPPPNDAIILWNGRDLAGWKTFLANADVNLATVWSVSNDVLRLSGKPLGYIRTENVFSNFHLHLEWRWPETNGNSGVLLHVNPPDAIWPVTLECQLKAGAAGEMIGLGDVDFSAPVINNRKRAKISESSENPPGQWNAYDIFCRGNSVEAFVNGVLKNKVADVSVQSGQIGLQSEGAPIEFRNVWLKSLPPTTD